MDVHEALRSRKSVRAFLPRPVPEETIRDILALAAQAPSGSNTQPWRVYVLTGATRDALCSALHAFRNANPEGGKRQYEYYPTRWREPYLARRRKTGWGLYALLGIARGETDKAFRQHGRNFSFFDAPVGLMFTIDADLERGSWVDYGMFLQSIMVAARGFGLDSCAEASIAEFHPIIRAQLAVPESETVICGIALGYADRDAIINGFRTTRQTVESFTSFHD